MEGKDYGMPSEVMMVGFFYNKGLFEQAGIKHVPVTYEEFTDAVDKLKGKGIKPRCYNYPAHPLSRELFLSLLVCQPHL